MELNLRFLHTFSVVAASGSISLAARQLRRAQPAVSRQIKLLEEQLGSILFERDHGGVRLTTAGAKLMDVVAPSLRRIEEVVDRLRGQVQAQRFRVGALTEAGQMLLMPRLLAFQADWSGLQIDMHYDKEAELKSLFAAGSLDAIVVTSADGVDPGGLIELERERAVLVTRAPHRRDIRSSADLQASRFIAYRAHDPLLTAYLAEHHPGVSVESLDVAVSVNSHRSMLDALLAVDAYSVMPWQSVADHLAARAVRLASPLEMTGSLLFAYRAGWAETRLGAALIAHLAESR